MPVVQSRPLLATVTHITMTSTGSGLGEEAAALGMLSGSGTLTANRAVLVPITIDQPVTAFQLWATSSPQKLGNVDLGIYRSDFTRIVSTGSIATSGFPAGGLITYDIVDTVLDRGLYYLAFVNDNATTSFTVYTGSATPTAGTTNSTTALGVFAMASAFPLPATITPAAQAASSIPWVGMSVRAIF